MSGPEVCKNPNCIHYEDLQYGACEFREKEKRMDVLTEADLFGNQLGDMQNGRLVKLCGVCGGLAGDTARHLTFHNALNRLLGLTLD